MQMIAWPYNDYASVLYYTIMITNSMISTHILTKKSLFLADFETSWIYHNLGIWSWYQLFVP